VLYADTPSRPNVAVNTLVVLEFLKAGKQRMDSVQVASNIRQMARVQLLVEVLQRAEQMLNEADRGQHREAFEPM
jgi:hypothetical protein